MDARWRLKLIGPLGERFGIWSSEPDDHASNWTAHSYPATARDWATKVVASCRLPAAVRSLTSLFL
jgi:hypothetical protein